MKKYAILLTVLMLFTTNSFAQLLYKIEGNNLNSVSYIYGTIHVMPKKDFEISKSIQSSFNACQVLAMEVDLNMDFKTQLEAAQQSFLPEGKTIADLASADDVNKVKQFCIDSMHWKESKYEKMSRLKPFFLSSVILQELIGKSKSFEKEFNNLAKKKKMTTIGLETLQFQMNMVNTVSNEEQMKMLLQGLSTNNSEFNKMLAAYLRQDLTGLGNLMNDAELSPEFNENLLLQRNRNWIPIISKLISEKPTFIAVGAGHLPGEKGVLNLLREAGYTVTPVN
ncbi:MAG: TraB/GumN family protein [Bacteroidetes bacterium]|nr:TraB/GumN family protein [Bacteroidota bacterium]